MTTTCKSAIKVNFAIAGFHMTSLKFEPQNY